jgi:hypothetical protein
MGIGNNINVSGGLASALVNRQARPLNGKEVRDALEHHVFLMTDRLLEREGFKSDVMVHQIEQVSSSLAAELSKYSQLNRINIAYPKVGWSIKLRLEELEDRSSLINGEVELDLERNVRLNLRFGLSGVGNVISTLEEERIPSNTPDTLRKQFDLPVTADVVTADGRVEKVNLSKFERKAARTADVGSGAVGLEKIEVYGEVEIEGEVVPGLVQKNATGGEVGLDVVLPRDLPEITLDDVVATPPEIEKTPIETPLPAAGGMSKVTRPGVKFKR